MRDLDGFGMRMTDTAFADWHGGLAAAMQAVGRPEFADLLTQALRSLVDFEICMTFSYARHDQVRCLHHNMAQAKAQIVIEDYVRGPYLLDPFFQEVKRGRTEGFAALAGLAPDRFYSSEYFSRHYARTGIGDEMGLFFPVSANRTAVLSITRPNRIKRFSAAEKNRFAALAPVVRVLGSRHYGSEADGEGAAVPSAGTAQSLIDTAFETFGTDLLTSRESQVVSLVLKGHSTGSIASVLEISHGTVKTHRKNAYERLGISSQAELFSRFLSSLKAI